MVNSIYSSAFELMENKTVYSDGAAPDLLPDFYLQKFGDFINEMADKLSSKVGEEDEKKLVRGLIMISVMQELDLSMFSGFLNFLAKYITSK